MLDDPGVVVRAKMMSTQLRTNASDMRHLQKEFVRASLLDSRSQATHFEQRDLQSYHTDLFADEARILLEVAGCRRVVERKEMELRQEQEQAEVVVERRSVQVDMTVVLGSDNHEQELDLMNGPMKSIHSFPLEVVQVQKDLNLLDEDYDDLPLVFQRCFRKLHFGKLPKVLERQVGLVVYVDLQVAYRFWYISAEDRLLKASNTGLGQKSVQSSRRGG
jgi:hypothetical protein